MGAASKYVTAVVAGALTAGVGAAGVLAVPPDTAVAPESANRDIDLAASITIPIIDIDTPGPISIIRQVFLTLGAETNTIFASTDSKAGTIYDLPGLYTNFQQTGGRDIFATRVPGQSIGTGYASAFEDANEWSLLDFVESASQQTRSSAVNLTGFTGGAQGIGAGLDGVLSNSAQSGDFSVGDFFETTSGSSGVFGGFDGEVAAFPFDGFKAVGGAVPLDRSGSTSIRLGSLEAATSADVALDGGAGLCLGSAKASCGGHTSFLEVGAPVEGGLAIAGNNIISGDFSQNRLASTLGNGQFSVQGAIGGTVKVGSLSIGQPIPINIQIPRASSMLSSTSTSQQQSVRNSFMAVPRSLGSDNGTASTGRHAAKDFVNSAISDVKTTVNKVLNSKPKHAKPEADSDSAA
jgi:hypothetical protein